MGLRTPDYTFEAYIPKHLEIRCYKESFLISANADIYIDGERVKNIGFLPKDVEHYQGLMNILNDKSLDVLAKEELEYIKSSEYCEIDIIFSNFFNANYSGNCLHDLKASSPGKSMYFCKNLKIKGERRNICAYKTQFDEYSRRLSIVYYDHDCDCMRTAVYNVPSFFIKCVKAAIKKHCIKELNSSYPNLSFLFTPYISYY